MEEETELSPGMNRKKALLFFIPIGLAVFFFAPLIPRQVDVPCSGVPLTTMTFSGWQSPSYALFGVGIFLPPSVGCFVN